MFVQIIKGRSDDPTGLEAGLEAWKRDLSGGATGWLGSTNGFTADGQFVGTARFDSQESARANSDRPEQGQWWAEFSKLTRDVTFVDGDEVVVLGAGGSDSAGWVQVQSANCSDIARVNQIFKEFENQMPEFRPDWLGGLSIAVGSDVLWSVDYFRSESEAREGEKKELPAEAKAAMEEWQSLVTNQVYYDLSSLWLASP